MKFEESATKKLLDKLWDDGKINASFTPGSLLKMPDLCKIALSEFTNSSAFKNHWYPYRKKKGERINLIFN